MINFKNNPTGEKVKDNYGVSLWLEGFNYYNEIRSNYYEKRVLFEI